MPDIFTPLQIKSKELKNRIVMGAAERVGFTYEDGLMGEVQSADSNGRFCGAKRTRCGASGLVYSY